MQGSNSQKRSNFRTDQPQPRQRARRWTTWRDIRRGTLNSPRWRVTWRALGPRRHRRRLLCFSRPSFSLLLPSRAPPAWLLPLASSFECLREPNYSAASSPSQLPLSSNKKHSPIAVRAISRFFRSLFSQALECRGVDVVIW